MPEVTQEYIDKLIKFIEITDKKESVTNVIVATVLDYLNRGYRKVLDEIVKIYLSGGTIDFDKIFPMRMMIFHDNDCSIAWGETKTITCRVFRGFEDVTADITKWTVTRDSGIVQDDAAWLLKTKVRDFAGTIDICFNATENDIGNNSNSVSTLFTFTAELPGAPAPVTYQLTI